MPGLGLINGIKKKGLNSAEPIVAKQSFIVIPLENLEINGYEAFCVRSDKKGEERLKGP